MARFSEARVARLLGSDGKRSIVGVGRPSRPPAGGTPAPPSAFRQGLEHPGVGIPGAGAKLPGAKLPGAKLPGAGANLPGGIIRNRLKVNAAVTNARCFLKVQEEFGSFDNYIWRFVDGQTIQHRFKNLSDIPPTSKESDALSKDLRGRGFKFVGSTIMYAHMQAAGLVNDHLVTCFRYAALR
ncbi:MAG: DNA-3-methyladenine glycosylase I [Phycisphaeraceae bacterium]|nr:DNA-3-methyladenine glycosylase I [Phycisphaeraceae bacterium]